jgi:aspartate/glutamate racemase
MIRVVAVHTAMALVEPVTELFKEHLPDVKLNHIVDDSLIQEVIAHNEVTNAVRKRLFSYYHTAVDAGANLIFNMCSSVGEVAEAGRLFVPIPILRIDEPMAIRAVKEGNKIGVLATLETTLAPTVALLKKKARERNCEIQIVEGLAKGAFQAVMAGDGEKHDRLILETAERIKSRVDLFVLAQGSMARMEKQVAGKAKKKVLSSPLSGVLGVKNYLSKNKLIY